MYLAESMMQKAIMIRWHMKKYDFVPNCLCPSNNPGFVDNRLLLPETVLMLIIFSAFKQAAIKLPHNVCMIAEKSSLCLTNEYKSL